MYMRHEEYTGTVNESVEQVFKHLDDHSRLSAHMSKRSWKMGWGRMNLRLDDKGGHAVGSHIVLDGTVLGVHLHLDEVVTERVPPVGKAWETVGEPRLLVIGPYRMGFELRPIESASQLRVTIDYDLPSRGISRVLGRVLHRSYAKWCTRRMVYDAQRSFA